MPTRPIGVKALKCKAYEEYPYTTDAHTRYFTFARFVLAAQYSHVVRARSSVGTVIVVSVMGKT